MSSTTTNESDSGAATTAAAGAGSSQTQPSVVIVTLTSSQTDAAQTQAPVIITMFSTVSLTPSASRARSSTASSPTSNTITQSSQGAASSGLSQTGTIATAVAVPVGVILIAAILGIFFWRRRKRSRHDLAQRKEEVDIYTFHPNDSAMADAGVFPSMSQYQPHSATAAPYRGWQPTATRQLSGSGTSKLNPQNSSNLGRSSENSHNVAQLEHPTLPTFFADDLDSVAPESPQQDTFHNEISRSQVSPGNGSPPLSAILENNFQGQGDGTNNVVYESAVGGAPYPTERPMTNNMPALMPSLQRSLQRQPNVQNTPGVDTSQRFSYTNF